MAVDEGEGSDFDKGFHGEMFAGFEQLGEEAVLRKLSAGDYRDVERAAAETWLRRKARATASAADIRANLALATAIASFLIALVALVVSIGKG
jgi:hypothetical protein